MADFGKLGEFVQELAYAGSYLAILGFGWLSVSFVLGLVGIV